MSEVLPEIDEEFVRAALAEVAEFTAQDVEQFVALGLRSSMVVPLTSAGGVARALGVGRAVSAVIASGDRDWSAQPPRAATTEQARASVATRATRRRTSMGSSWPIWVRWRSLG